MRVFLPFVLTFILAMILGPFYIKFAKKLKFGQNILGYVEEHKVKQGTPTMGGVIFVIPTLIVSLILCGGDKSFAILALAIFVGYGIVGFLDDFIKIKFKRNLGLTAMQKIIFQLVLAVIVAVFVYKNAILRNQYLPFGDKMFDLGWLVIPFIIIVFLATTNSVNLTDGLDGLAGGVSLAYFVFFAVIIGFYSSNVIDSSLAVFVSQMDNLQTLCYSVAGGLCAYLIFNFYPAKIFMGDTGSLALGGLASCVACFSGTTLYIPIIGFMFVVSSVSVILQVLHFKRTKKRIFLMAPFHHHLQHKGMYETKIVVIYIITTVMLGLLTITLLGVI